MLSKENFIEHFAQLSPDFREKNFLLAVSGGADSMVLLHLFLNLNIHIEVAHVNYHLRGEDSNLDQKLVQDFCAAHAVKFHLYEAVSQDEKPKNIEIWARNLRYKFFFDLLEKHSLDYLATAHHLNDQLETFLIHLSRGSGITGLSGIPENKNQILRPLLHFTKKEIYNYAQKNEIPFREDRTNAEDHFLRNRIRHHITPELEKTHPAFWVNFDKSINFLNQYKSFIESKILETLNDITLESNENQWIIDKNKLKTLSNIEQYEVFKKLGFPNVLEQKKLWGSENGKKFIAEEGTIYLHQNKIILLKNNTIENFNYSISLELNKKINFPQNLLIADYKIADVSPDWEIDLKKIKLPLKLRKPENGEYFYPKGMQGKKRIVKFFRDERIPIFARSNIWLLVDAENQILGILGYRQDSRFVGNESNEKLYVYL